MRILITGGAGFIGSHLAEAHLDAGDEVAVLDDLSTGAMDNIGHLKHRERFSYIVDSVMNLPVLAELVDGADQIYHLAAAVGVKLIVHSPVRTIETNVHGTENVLKVAAKKQKKVFVASTSEVYGKPEKIPFSEDDDLVMGPTIRARWAYACSKALDEFLALAYYKEKNLPVVVVRLFNTVGPRQTGRYGMVIPTFVRQALAGEPITVYGDGSQRRAFTYVGDVVWALRALSRKEEAVGKVFNIGSDSEIRIDRLAEMVKDLTGSSSPIVKIPYDQAYEAGFEDMMRRVPDISRLSDLTGYRSTLAIRGILEKVIEEQRARMLAGTVS